MDKKLAVVIGRGVRRARVIHGITQEQTAELIGVSTEFYARMERGQALPSVSTMVKICDCLDVSADVLVNGDVHERIEWQFRAPALSAELNRLIRKLRKVDLRIIRAIIHVVAAINTACTNQSDVSERHTRRHVSRSSRKR